MVATVLIVDDKRIVREGVRCLLTGPADIEVVGEASIAGEAIRVARELSPSVIITEAVLPDMRGAEVVRELVQTVPSANVVVLAVRADRVRVSAVLAAGAVGYLLKTCTGDELVHAVREAAAGRSYLAAEVNRIVVRDYRRLARGDGQPRALSPREVEVLGLIARGESTKAIAGGLGLSVKTIETHRRQIMDKLGIYHVPGLVKYAVLEGITSLEE